MMMKGMNEERAEQSRFMKYENGKQPKLKTPRNKRNSAYQCNQTYELKR
jgi:hypothetical protein